MPAVLILFIVIVAIGFIGKLLAAVFEEVAIYLEPSFVFIGDNIYIILGFTSFTCAAYFFFYYKPHPVEKYLKSYKKGELPQAIAVEKVADAMYNPERDHIQPAYRSKYMEKRIKMLTKRIKAEEEFMQEVIAHIKTRSRFD